MAGARRRHVRDGQAGAGPREQGRLRHEDHLQVACGAVQPAGTTHPATPRHPNWRHLAHMRHPAPTPITTAPFVPRLLRSTLAPGTSVLRVGPWPHPLRAPSQSHHHSSAR
eukprot:856128-Prymnesium_polylepis.1